MFRSGAGIALSAAALLILSACSSGTPSAATTASSHPMHRKVPPAVLMPAVPVVASVRIGPYVQEFGTPLPRNRAAARVIESFREAKDLWTASLIGRHPARLISLYLTAGAFRRFRRALWEVHRTGLEPSGVDLLFDTRVLALSNAGATVMTCDDESRITATYQSTGQLQPASSVPVDQAYLFEIWHLVPLAGHWAIKGYSVYPLPDEGAEQCQPRSLTA